MKKITFKIKLFANGNPVELGRSRKTLLWLLEALVQHNIQYILAYRNVPKLYATDIIYQPEPHSEIWRDIPTMILDGYGDCEDLACYRIAELNVMGIAAQPYIKWAKNSHGGTTYHALVKRPDGRIEDPSLALGMRNSPIIRRPIFV